MRRFIKRKVTKPFDNQLGLHMVTLEERQMLSTVDIMAAGATNQETIQLKIDDVVVQTWDNVGGNADSGEFVKLSYQADQPISADRVSVAFVNDLYSPEQGIDRNVRIKGISIDGEMKETISSRVFSTGTWTAADGVAPGFRYSDYLHSNGEFKFDQRSLIEVKAKGDTGAEIMALQINGLEVASWQVNTELTSYFFETPDDVAPHQVRIQFKNDLYQPDQSIDRNLVVDKIVVNDSVIETEGAAVFSTGTWQSTDGIAPGFRQSEVLHTNGYFQFGFATLNEIQTLDGTNNNLTNTSWGAANTQLPRVAPSAYSDGLNSPSLPDAPNARDISNLIAAQSESVENDRFISSIWFQWGQFLDHDIVRSFSLDRTLPRELFPINDQMLFTRSAFDRSTGINTPREHTNFLSSYIDGTAVYGTTAAESASLRAKVGGRMAVTMTDSGELLPTAPGSTSFVAGDVRVNENITLAAMHTLWVREHNRIAAELASTEFAGRDLTDAAVDEEIFQRARKHVAGLIQHITYNEFLPSTLGFNAIPTYKGYDPSVNAAISNEFTTIIFRLGHTTLPDELLIGRDGEKIAFKDAFNNSKFLFDRGIDGIFSGLSAQKMEEIDPLVADGVRNALADGPGGVDLAARNIQRGRDHGLPNYNAVREAIGLRAVATFGEITSDAALAEKLTTLYGSPDHADAWIVAISEDHVPGASVGETLYAYMVDQFVRLRDGDRFYFENHLDSELVAEIKSTRLSDVIRRNSSAVVQDEVFWTPDALVFRNNLDNEWLIRDFGDNGGVEVVFFGVPGVRDPNNRTEIVTARRDEPIKAVIVAGTNENGDGFFVPNAVLPRPLADQGIDEFIVTASIDFFEAYGLGGNDRWVIESDVKDVFISGDDGDDVISIKTNRVDSNIVVTGDKGHDRLTVFAPSRGSVKVDAGDDFDSVFVYAGTETILSIDGQEEGVIVKQSDAPKFFRPIDVAVWHEPTSIKDETFDQVVSKSRWTRISDIGWRGHLNHKFNADFSKWSPLPQRLDVRVVWA